MELAFGHGGTPWLAGGNGESRRNRALVSLGMISRWLHVPGTASYPAFSALEEELLLRLFHCLLTRHLSQFLPDVGMSTPFCG